VTKTAEIFGPLDIFVSDTGIDDGHAMSMSARASSFRRGLLPV
jgi:hypothetical protein